MIWKTRRSLTSRDVHFVPNVFPFKEGTSPSVPDLILPVVHPNVDVGSSSGEVMVESSADDADRGVPSPSVPIEVEVPDTRADTPPPDSTLRLRRSKRVTEPLVWMQDYIGNIVHTSVPFTEGTTPPMFPYLVSPVLTSSYVDYLFNVNSVVEPHSYKEAFKYPEWISAMEQELAALETNQTWELTALPPGKKPIGCKWVYKIKLRADGQLDRCKARLVAKGYDQQFGMDYTEVFSPVAKHVTVRLLITMATVYSCPLHQLDVNNAFLHGFLKDDIYMVPPQGYTGAAPGQVCRLIKSLYGLKQASREWNMEFCRQMFAQGFVQSPSDHCLFTRGTAADFICLLVYVDDVLVTGPS